MTYNFKKLEEAGWFAATAAGIAVATALVTFDPATILDWKAWVVGVLGATVRAAAGAVLAWFAANKTEAAAPPAAPPAP